ncbi:MFS transporter [Zafaria cholistanensis]|uniref:MFS transporter n=1 Tax=Zafaria cholistanensis TaxID=1682741 RepID=A0A5A7NU70_9MICC|nr:MFS transporter [Zafaria cholistanensis]
MVVLCWLAVVFDGYDLIVFGVAVPELLEYKAWNLNPVLVGQVGSLGLVGMFFGALASGTLSGRYGPRKLLITSLIVFSLAMPLAAIAPTLFVFGLCRLVAGLGLGALMPVAIALTVEFSNPARRQLNNALMFSGFSVGGILAAVVGLVVLPVADFRVLFALGAAPLVLVLPFMLRFLPESIAFLKHSGREQQARETAARYGIPFAESPASQEKANPAALFKNRLATPTLLFWLVSFCGLLMVYGLNTWLPQIMRSSGYSLGSALTFLLVFNIGAVVGVIVAGGLADKLGEQRVIVVSFLMAAAAVLLLATKPDGFFLYFLIAVAGFGSNTQTLVNAFVAGFYPAHLRPTGLGWALGVGRLGAIVGPTYGGIVMSLVAAGAVGNTWNFYAFVIPSIIAAVLLSLVKKRPLLATPAVPPLGGDEKVDAEKSASA